LREPQSLRRQAIEIPRLDLPLAVRADVPIAKVIRKNENNVRLACLDGLARRGRAEHEKRGQKPQDPDPSARTAH
jgi:hypothetical protein